MAVRHRVHRRVTVRSYARRLTLHRWHSLAEWRAVNVIVGEESGWDACAVYPSRHDCFYRGPSSCGLPQRQPCPAAWQGRLYRVRFAQVRWTVAYIAARYGDPLAALAFHRAHGYY